jgi:hypothetical protein
LNFEWLLSIVALRYSNGTRPTLNSNPGGGGDIEWIAEY